MHAMWYKAFATAIERSRTLVSILTKPLQLVDGRYFADPMGGCAHWQHTCCVMTLLRRLTVLRVKLCCCCGTGVEGAYLAEVAKSRLPVLLFIFCFDIACYLFRFVAKVVKLHLLQGEVQKGST